MFQVVVPHNHSRFDEIKQIVAVGTQGCSDGRATGDVFNTQFANGGDEAASPTHSGIWNSKPGAGANINALNAMFPLLNDEWDLEPTFSAAYRERGVWIWTSDRTVSQINAPQYNQWFNGIHGTPPMRPWQPSEQPVAADFSFPINVT